MKSKKLYNRYLLAICGVFAILSISGGVAITTMQKADALEQTDIISAVESYNSILPEGVHMGEYTVLDLDGATIAANVNAQYDMVTHQAVRFQYNKTDTPWGLSLGVYNDERGYYQPYNSGYFYLWNGNSNQLQSTIFGTTVTGSMPSWMERGDIGDYNIEYGGVKCYDSNNAYAGEYYYLEIDGCIIAEYFHASTNENAITTSKFTLNASSNITISPYETGTDISTNAYVEMPKTAFANEEPVPIVYYMVEKENQNYVQVIPDAYYDVSYSEDTTALTGSATIAFKDKYTGMVQCGYTLVPPLDLTKFSVTLLENVIEYKGMPICPHVVSVNYEGEAIPQSDYDVSYANNDGIGTGEVIITLKNEYHGEIKTYFSIIKETIPIDSIPDAVYIGDYNVADISDLAGTDEVHLNNQWQYFYEMNNAQGVRFTTEIVKNPSWATEIMIHVPESVDAERFWYKGYNLSISKQQKITLYAGNKVIAEADLPLWGYFTEIGNIIDVEFATAPLYLKSNGEYYGDYLYLRFNEVKLIGKVLVGAAMPEKGCYVCLGSYLDADLKLTDIAPKDISEDLRISCPSAEYTGEEVMPIPTVYYEKQIDNSIYTIELDSCDYTLSYENNTGIGTGTVRVTLRGKYVGEISTTFTIEEAKQQTPSQPEKPQTDSSSSSSGTSSEQKSGCASSVAISAPILAGLLCALYGYFVKKKTEK